MASNKVEIGFAPKTVKLDDGSMLHFWYANNKGRGGNNVTIIRSRSSRASLSRKQEGIIAMTLTSSWRGDVNFSRVVQKALGVYVD